MSEPNETTADLTLHLLREMRDEIRGIHGEIAQLRVEMHEKFDDMETRMNGNTMILNFLAGKWFDVDERLKKLEP